MATITKTIGSAPGRDYASVQAWADAIPTDVVGSGFCYTGLLYNDSEFTDVTGKLNLANKTTDATHFITLKCADGQSFSTNPNRASNALWYNQANGVAIKTTGASVTAIKVYVPYTVIDGLQITATGTGSLTMDLNGTGIVAKNCICLGVGPNAPSYGTMNVGGGAVLMDSLVGSIASGSASGVKLTNGTLINCTIVKPSQYSLGASETSGAVYNNYGTNVIKNCALFGFANRDITPNSFSSSDYNATDWNQAPGGTLGVHNLTSLAYANQFISTNNDFRLKGTSDLVDKGINLSANYQVADIIGTSRQTLWDIGANEVITPATAVKINGPTLGQTGAASQDFVVSTDGSVGTATHVTPDDGGAGGTFNPTSLTLLGTSPTATFKYTPSQTGNITISLTNDGGLANPAPVTYVSAVAATHVNISGPATCRAGVASANFTAALDGYVSSAVKVTPSDGGDGGTFSPPFVMLDNSTTSAPFTYTGTSAGAKTISATNDASLINGSTSVTEKPPIVPQPTPSTPTLVVKSIGTGKDFATIKAFTDYAATFDLTANQQSLLGEVYESQTLSAQSTLSAKNPTGNFKVILQPVPGTSANYLDKGGPADYGTEGIELTVNNQWFVNSGTVLQDFKFNVVGSTGSLVIGSYAAYPDPIFQRNRVKASGTATAAVYTGQYNDPGIITDCLFILDDGSTSNAVNGQGVRLIFKRNTLVRRGSASGFLLTFSTSQNTTMGTTIANNAFINAGNTPVNNLALVAPSYVTNNFTDNAMLTASAGFTTVLAGSGTNLVRDTAHDFRPDDNGALIGAASSAAIDQIDMYGVARGGSPDAGAIQGTIVNLLPKVAITTQDINAQAVTVSGTSTYGPTSGTVTLLPDPNNPNGAIQQGPIPAVLGSNSFTATFTDVPPGNYQIPLVTLINPSGYNRTQTGGDVVTVIPITASVVAGEASPAVGNAPVVTFGQKGFDLQAFNINGTVDIQGDTNCTLQAFVDPQPSGTALGPFTVNRIGSLWAVLLPNMTGSFKVRIVGTANGKTSTVSSATYTVLKATSSFVLPSYQ